MASPVLCVNVFGTNCTQYGTVAELSTYRQSEVDVPTKHSFTLTSSKPSWLTFDVNTMVDPAPAVMRILYVPNWNKKQSIF